MISVGSALFIEQCLNGIQLGMMLFLLTAGLTLVFGIMDFVNLAHGSLFMLGAFIAAWLTAMLGSFYAALPLAIIASLLVGLALEAGILRNFYGRHHLDHVLATFGLVLIFNEVARLIWGAQGLSLPLPTILDTAIPILPGIDYSLFKLMWIAGALATAGGLAILITRTRIGMRIRAGASDREIVAALGVNVRLLFTLIFGLGAALAGFAGAMAAPILSASIGMGEEVLILSFVVIVIGGIGSVRGAFIAALLVGLVDTLGRAYLVSLLSLFLPAKASSTLGPSLSSMLIYIVMAAVLALRPQGLFSTPR